MGMLVAPAVLAQASGSGVPAEQVLNDRFAVELGTFVVSSKINGNLRGTINTQTGIDFSQRFGSDADQTRGRAGFLWRITPRHALRFSYFNNDVTHTRDIPPLTWGDYTFSGQTTAETKFQIYDLGYEFSFLNNSKYKVAATAGLHVENFTIKLSGNAILTNPDGTTQAVNGAIQSNSVTAPLPVVGLRGDWAATDHLYLDGLLQVFKFNYQGIDGNWSDFRAGATWMFTHHFGIGLGFDRWAFHVSLNKQAFNGHLNLGYQGGLLFIRAGF